MYTRNCEIKAGVEFPEDMHRVALGVEYSGKSFNGFQRQMSTPNTVQQKLETALSSVANEKVTLVCAGRTDAGVHASGQVVHFDTLSSRPKKAWIQGVNALLPDAIRVIWAKEVVEAFHARFSAQSRQYRYVIHPKSVCSAMMIGQVSWVKRDLDLEAMKRGASFLIGEHDFTSFRASKCQANNAIRTIKTVRVDCIGEFIVFDIRANGFLYHMVRNIVGTLLEVAQSKKEPEWVRELLQLNNRNLAAATADPDGLYLTNIEYSGEFNLPRPKVGPVFL